MSENPQLTQLLDLANNYPSPHNGQPMQLRSREDGVLEAYFATERGLTATPISYLFSFVSIGVFIRHFERCAEALGHTLAVQLQLPKQEQMAGPGVLKCAEITVQYATHEPDTKLQQVIIKRQTSRKKYTAGLTADEEEQVKSIANDHDIAAEFVNTKQARQVIWLNQRAVFDDMFDPKVRAELDHWLRYSAQEKHMKKDGLAYDCMELSGAAMRFSVRHYKVLHWPVVAPLLQRYYLRTMQDDSSVGYFTSAFQTEEEAYRIGECIIDVWLMLTGHGQYLHPFGTVVSNDRAHHDFAQLVGLHNENRDKNYVVFIFRAGASAKPVESDRLPVTEHLYNQA